MKGKKSERPKAMKRTEQVLVRLTEAEKEVIKYCANGKPLGRWVREQALKAAGVSAIP